MLIISYINYREIQLHQNYNALQTPELQKHRKTLNYKIQKTIQNDHDTTIDDE